MGDCDDLVLLGFKSSLDLVQGDNTPDIGSQRIYLGAVCLQARVVEESVSIKETEPFDANAPIGEGVAEVASVQNQSTFAWLDQVRSDLRDRY